MHALTATEAYFTYMGIYWYQEISKFLQSDHFVRALFLLIFGILFMMTAIHLFARHMGTTVIGYRHVTVGSLANVVVCYLLGMACLKVGTGAQVSSFERESWESSPYVVSRLGSIDKDIKLSLPVSLMTRSSEELGWVLAKITDKLMGGPNSETQAPNVFYKAMMLAGATTIDDPDLRERLELYTGECIDPILSRIQDLNSAPTKNWDDLVNLKDGFTQDLASIKLGEGKTCVDLRQEIQNGLNNLGMGERDLTERIVHHFKSDADISTDKMTNQKISSALLNFYASKGGDDVGTLNGAKVPGGFGRTMQYIGRFSRPEGFTRFFGNNNGRSVAGSGLAIDRANEFNEQLKMAPMVLGLSKAGLLVLSSLLPFFLIARKWKIVIWWWAVYASLCVWPAIWIGLSKLLTNVFAVPDILSQFGAFNDGFSVFAAGLINEQAYYIASAILWAQIAVGPGLTGIVGFFAGQWLLSSREDHLPTPIQEVTNIAVSGAKGAVFKGVMND